MGLVKLQLPQPLHTRVKAVAASKEKGIKLYILEVLEEHVPRKIEFSTDPKAKKSPDKITGL
jgi:hypothetical protein